MRFRSSSLDRNVAYYAYAVYLKPGAASDHGFHISHRVRLKRCEMSSASGTVYAYHRVVADLSVYVSVRLEPVGVNDINTARDARRDREVDKAAVHILHVV